FGVIGNGHLIQLDQRPGEESVWDTEFESEFQQADNWFPALIDWLLSLGRPDLPSSDGPTPKFCPQHASDDQLAMITECLVSLAVRSPLNRNMAVSLAEMVRGDLPERQRNALIGANMRGTQRKVADSIGCEAKFAVIFSPECELIFGDGFFHNVRSPVHSVFDLKVLAPITPNLAVALTRPIQYRVEPKLVTTVVTKAQADILNHAVQVYARDALFYRSDPPVIDDAFRQGRHSEYSHPDNPIDSLLRQIPGVPPRSTSLDRSPFR
ncbi:MAG TPA: hypothetical protein VFO86_16725, partial [Terriglobia bacterium]|nr:hypothetical protein [Terriglobia bacterium]